MTDRTHVNWRAWGAEAFSVAADRHCPVLLSLSATWCDGCHEMDATTYADPRIAANINEGFVPIRVDVDRHPRVRERYNMGGFPTTAFLTPTGELLSGAGYLGVDDMRQALESVRKLWADHGPAAGRVPRALDAGTPPSGSLTAAIEEHLSGQLEVQYDETHAGWGTDAKFPLARTVEFALKRDRARALGTLDAISEHLSDDVAGGFFRFAGARDWSDVAYEKPIDTNAAVTRAFANAYLYTGDEAYRETAQAAVDFLTDDLWTGDGVGGSLGPGLGRAYYAVPAAEREMLDQPRRDHTVYAGGNALAADALLTVAAYTDDERASEYARRILSMLERELIDVDTGTVTRYRATNTADSADDDDDDEAGNGTTIAANDVGEQDLLTDTARVVSAYTRAAMVLGEGVDIARAVADRAIDRLHVDGSFVDGPRSGPGLLDRPFRPLDGNVELATALVDLSAVTGEDRYRQIAHETAESFAGATDRLGVQVAGYGSLVGRLRRGTTVVAVGTEPGTDLHRAALRVADHEKVVVPNAHDPNESAGGFAGVTNETADPGVSDSTVAAGRAVVMVNDRTSNPATTPDELLMRVGAILE